MFDDDKMMNLFERKVQLDEVRTAVGESSLWGSDTALVDSAMEEATTEAGKLTTPSQAPGRPDQTYRPDGPVGLDIGTSHIVAAHSWLNHAQFSSQLNAFFTIPVSKFSRRILKNHDIMFFERGELFYIIGHSADSFANMFNTTTRRPIQSGLLSPSEKEGMSVVQAVITTLIQKPRRFGEVLCFGVPGEPLQSQGQTATVTYHEQVLKMYLQSLGYAPISINEGMAVILAELGDDDYTGIGISMGGGMCNVCLSYLSFPVITFSIQMAGDYIDRMTGLAVAEPSTKIKGIKEAGLDLTREPRDAIYTALHIYYDEVIQKLLVGLQRMLAASDKLPKIAKSIPIVLAGGTAMPRGCQAKVTKALDRHPLPVTISEVRMARDPLNATARGALFMALAESG